MSQEPSHTLYLCTQVTYFHGLSSRIRNGCLQLRTPTRERLVVDPQNRRWRFPTVVIGVYMLPFDRLLVAIGLPEFLNDCKDSGGCFYF
jgi:hypothetical protein